MKNDITYEYRVFTHRLIDVESMEVGICTSKVIKEIKPKDKVNGRFFHTSDTDEWFFCWNNELQKLNLKGDSDINAALNEVKKLISDANAAVKEAEETATEAKAAAAEAKAAADAASAAVESIGNKADKSEVEAVSKAVEAKADVSVVESLSKKVDDINVPTNVSDLTNDMKFVTEAELKQKGYATTAQVDEKQDVITDLDAIRANAEKGATALQEVPDTYATKEYVGQQIDGINLPTVPTNVSKFTNDAGYLTKDVADGYYAALGTTGSGDGVTKEYVDTELAKKQNIINDIDDIRLKANSALQSIPDEYVTDEELNGKGYLTAQDISGKQDVITDLETIRTNAEKGATALQAVPEEYVTETELGLKGYITNQALGDYYTKDQVDGMIKAINDLIGQATDKTNTILA